MTNFLFELQPLRKWTQECPLCSHTRKKVGARSLTVYRDLDKYIRWQCWHPGCEWNVRQWAKDPNPEEVQELKLEDEVIIPIFHEGELPKEMDGKPLWWYHDEHNLPRFGVVRSDTENGKEYFPVTLLQGKPHILKSWPSISIFYGHENLHDHETVLVVEGEKTKDAAAALFPKVAVITWRGGARNIDTAPWDALVGKKVYIWPDNDEPGHNAAKEIIKKLVDMAEVYLVNTTNFPLKSDLADNLDHEKVKEALRNAYKIPKEAPLESTLEEIDEQERLFGQKFSIGWPELDSKIDFPKSGVLVIEGRTGHVKTGTAVNITANLLDMGYPVLYFSYEIPVSRLRNRYYRKYNPDGDTPQNDKVNEYIRTKQLRLFDQSKQINLERLTKILDNPTLCGSVIVVENAQIVPGRATEMRNKIIDLIDMLRIRANTHGFLVLLLSQVTPDTSNPIQDTPRDAKDIYMSAEMVIRIWLKDEEQAHPAYDDVPGNLIMHIIKNRDGEKGHMIGFSWYNSALLTPNGHMQKMTKIRKEPDRLTKAVETFVNMYQERAIEL